jgi:putative oxidoreductase
LTFKAVPLWVVIAIEVLGGLALILGFHTRFVAIGLAVFTVLASITGHAFWAAPVDAAFIAQLLFIKNIAVTGGLLVLASSGAGSISIDGRKAKAE